MREAAASGAPPALQRVRLGDCPPQPWRNGGGLTRELLAWATAAHDTAAVPGTAPPAWTVRVSVAEITRDGPFSPYPGVDRAFAVLEGRGVVLAWPQGGTVCRPGDEALRFDGAQAPGCRLVDGPTLDLNLMVQASAGRAAMRLARPGSSGPAPGRWRGLYAHGGGRLATQGGVVTLEPGTLCWQATGAARGADDAWQLLESDLAFWLALEPDLQEAGGMTPTGHG